MMYKNTFRLFFSNASNIWKTFLYLLVTGLVTALSLLIALPVIKELNNVGVFSQTGEIFTNLFSLLEKQEFGSSLLAIYNNFLDVIFDKRLIGYVIAFCVIIVIATNIFSSIYSLSMADNMYGYMSSGFHGHYTVSIFSTLKKGLLLGLTKLIIVFPVDMIIIVVLSYCVKLFTLGGLYAVFAPIIIFATFTILYSFRLTLFCGWESAICVNDCSIFRGLKLGIVAVNRRFARTLGCSFALMLTILSVNIFASLFTLGFCLVITIPSSWLLVSIFGNVMYFSSQGMRFYVEDDFVISPKRLEVTDSPRKTKFEL